MPVPVKVYAMATVFEALELRLPVISLSPLPVKV